MVLKIVTLDLEMADDYRNTIIEVGACLGLVDPDNKTSEIIDTFSSYVFYPYGLSTTIAKLTKIKDSDLAVAPTLLEVGHKFIEWVKAHNPERCALTWGGDDLRRLYLDLKFIDDGKQFSNKIWYFTKGNIDVKALFKTKALLSGLDPKKSLTRSLNALGLTFEGQQHSALADSINTFILFTKCIL